jgi:hypothetical protein
MVLPAYQTLLETWDRENLTPWCRSCGRRVSDVTVVRGIGRSAVDIALVRRVRCHGEEHVERHELSCWLWEQEAVRRFASEVFNPPLRVFVEEDHQESASPPSETPPLKPSLPSRTPRSQGGITPFSIVPLGKLLRRIRQKPIQSVCFSQKRICDGVCS